MALNAAEKNELRKLKAESLDDDGKPFDGARTKNLRRIEELQAKAEKPRKAGRPAKVRRHTLSDLGQELIGDGADYLGCRSRGDEVDEYFYRDGESLPREAVGVIGGKKTQVFGQTFSEELLESLSK